MNQVVAAQADGLARAVDGGDPGGLIVRRTDHVLAVGAVRDVPHHLEVLGQHHRPGGTVRRPGKNLTAAPARDDPTTVRAECRIV